MIEQQHDVCSVVKQQWEDTAGRADVKDSWICALPLIRDGKGDKLFQEKTRGCDQADMFPLGRWRLHTLCTLGKRPQ